MSLTMPQPRYYDAHCHWQDARLLPHHAQIARDLSSAGVARAVVNGTCPQDWPSVAALARSDARILPAFGLHPWHVNAVCNSQWLDLLKNFLEAFPEAAVGEIGLDNWIEGADKTLQREAFLAQLALAAEHNRPASIHCLRADGDLLCALKAAPALPVRGIHLHGFAGSVETTRQLLDMGAYFSFSEYIAEPKRTKARAVAQYIPLDRLLVETDAPDMMGPQAWQHYRLGTEPPAPKHPANITAAYACLAQLRGIRIEALAEHVENNFVRYFGNANALNHQPASGSASHPSER